MAWTIATVEEKIEQLENQLLEPDEYDLDGNLKVKHNKSSIYDALRYFNDKLDELNGNTNASMQFFSKYGYE